MPIYEYECKKCGVFDHEHPISAPPLARCPRCRSKVTKLISATAFHLKGGGWYADGYDRKKSGGEPDAKPEAKADATSSSGTESSGSADSGSAATGKASSAGKKKNAKSAPSGKSAAA